MSDDKTETAGKTIKLTPAQRAILEKLASDDALRIVHQTFGMRTMALYLTHPDAPRKDRPTEYDSIRPRVFDHLCNGRLIAVVPPNRYGTSHYQITDTGRAALGLPVATHPATPAEAPAEPATSTELPLDETIRRAREHLLTAVSMLNRAERHEKLKDDETARTRVGQAVDDANMGAWRLNKVLHP